MNIGDYVRTKDGRITKITKTETCCKINDSDAVYVENNNDLHILLGFVIPKEMIIKSSPNIIDLIEVGDILKFKDKKHYQEVLAIDKEKLYLTEYIYMSGLQKYKKEIEKDIEWVITNEQLSQIKYEVSK